MKVIVLDTETTNSLEEPICYDIGWAVVDADTGEIFKTASYAVAEIFLDKEIMSCAYFADKIPSYWDEIKHGERALARLYTIRKALREDCKAYGIKEIYAHNARFDYSSCTITTRYLTSYRTKYFFPFGVKICDTLKMSREAFATAEYDKFCKANEYITPNGKNRFTAEVLYRFISGQADFEEVHKGIDDVLIEKEILVACRQRGVFEGGLWG